MEKIRKRLIALVLMAVMVVCLLPMNVQAANNGMVRLDRDKTYTKYDVTGDGKRDTFKYMVYQSSDGYYYAKIYLNRKYVQKINVIRGGEFWICNAGKNNVYLIGNYLQASACTSVAYTYKGNKFKNISTFEEGVYSTHTVPLKLDRNILYIRKSRAKGTMSIFPQKGFNGASPITWIYKYTIKNGKIKLMSDYAIIGGNKVHKALNSFLTSKSVKLTDENGPKVQKNDMVVLKKWYKDRIQISVNGKTGWVDCSKAQFETKE